MDVGQSTPAASPAGPSRTPTPIDPHIPVQPAFFYPSGHNSVAHPVGPNGFLSPDQDPLATRGIPVFKPTYEEFCDFEKYMTRVEVWGRKSGIVKVIPPKEWSDALPPVKDLLPNLKLRHPIEQHMMGQGGLFRQNNVEKRRVLSLKDWAQLCAKDELKPYPIKDGQVQTRGLSRSTVTRKQRNSKKVKKEDGCELHPDESSQIDASGTPRAPEANVTSSDHAAGGGNVSLDLEGLPSGNVASPSKPKEDKDDPFYAEFDPRTSWLPEGTSADDYTPETCREIERVYWRTCGLGTPAQYGADMAGSLFTDQTKHWNVANLPSFLNRLCSRRSLPEDKTGLLPVHDPPQPSPSARPLIVKDKGGVERAIWKAHEQCARVIPETWIDEVDGQRFVFGVDAIVKDRWALKCTDCTRTTLKLHGAKIQCAKGKCPKAFHVTCATRAEDVSYKELGEDEKEVVLVVKPPTQDGTTVPGFLDGGSEPAANVVKTIRKLQVEVFCCQHNPLVQQRKKAAKQEQLRKDVLALPPEARVRIRNASGVYEVTVHSVNEGRDTVTVAWGNGQRKEIPWKHIIWGNIPEGTFVQKGEDAVS
ncbi:hypothetical protein FRB99_002560, partial [Tulasnella sp. 403]